jgi:branched-chain amino acid transport system ATP-binding protein
MSVLSVRHVSKRFGGLQALHDVSLETDGEILGLIGPNGAGKTTLFNLVSGFLRPTEGEIYYNGQPIHRHRPYQTVGLGIARTFQIVRPFGDLTVLDNVLSGYGQPFYSRPEAFFQRFRAPLTVEAAHEIMAFTGLTSWAHAPASSLPIGLQRRLEIARSLATQPQVLLLDEPAAGLTSQEADDLADLICTLHQQGKTIVVIEHNMHFAMALCQRIIVLERGRVIAQGTPAQVQADEKVVNAYLGQE